MAGKLKRIITLAVSLAFAGAASAAGIGGGQPRDPACDQRAANGCVSTWQTLGWPSYQTCVWGQQCIECPPNYGYLCPYPGMYAAEPKAVKPW
ncbi:MAG TPA: hypothetical protein VE053_13080 [Allosphingosinicella sp.]|nr:hypothetical protein [Allosphingosinicella sp.]